MSPERARGILRQLGVSSAGHVVVPSDVEEELREAGCISPGGSIDLEALVALGREAELEEIRDG